MNDLASIAAAVIVDDGLVLLVRRRVREGDLSWQFPAGAIESDETASEAAVREAYEETGLAVRVTAILGERVHPATHRTIHYIACDVLNGTAHVTDDEELAELAWCDRATLAVYVPYPFHGPVQDYLDATIR
jgi:8-oxo-dGTP diphosphatase